MVRADKIERRIFVTGGILVVLGAFLTATVFGMRQGASFLAGGVLSAANLAALRNTINTAMLRRRGRYRLRPVVVHILRLVLIPLCLYAMMRFLSLGIIAATAGFAAFSCGIFAEGVWEAFRSGAK
jgi:hypothetical protein